MATFDYYQLMGEVFGRVSPAEIHRLAALGIITRDTLVREGEDGDWVFADQVPGLFDEHGHINPALVDSQFASATAGIEQCTIPESVGQIEIDTAPRSSIDGTIDRMTHVCKRDVKSAPLSEAVASSTVHAPSGAYRPSRVLPIGPVLDILVLVVVMLGIVLSGLQLPKKRFSFRILKGSGEWPTGSRTPRGCLNGHLEYSAARGPDCGSAT